MLFRSGAEQEFESDYVAKKFTEHFGWINNAKMVSEFENIKLNEVWELPVIQFLNDLNYIKNKNELDAYIVRKSSKQTAKH